MSYGRNVHFTELFHKMSDITHKHPLVHPKRDLTLFILNRSILEKEGRSHKNLVGIKVLVQEKLILRYHILSQIHSQITELGII